MISHSGRLLQEQSNNIQFRYQIGEMVVIKWSGETWFIFSVSWYKIIFSPHSVLWIGVSFQWWWRGCCWYASDEKTAFWIAPGPAPTCDWCHNYFTRNQPLLFKFEVTQSENNLAAVHQGDYFEFLSAMTWDKNSKKLHLLNVSRILEKRCLYFDHWNQNGVWV